MNRPVTTLFMLMSVDGKISTGENDDLDFDKDFINITGVKEGLQQYYDIEQTTDIWSLNSGRVQAKMGVNEACDVSKTSVSFVIIDNHHLTLQGVHHFCNRAKNFVLVTSNKQHPAYNSDAKNLHIIYQEKLKLAAMLETLKKEYACNRITIQTGNIKWFVFKRKTI